MPPTAILYEIQKLYDVSDRLDSLSEQHPLVSEALISISGSVRRKWRSFPDYRQQMPDLRITI